MVNTQDGLFGKVILTITDSKGNVVLHETVSADDVDIIATRVLRTIR